MKRKNIRVGDDLVKWYEEKAEELGITQSSLIIMAMKQYRDQQEALNFAGGIDGIMKQLKQIQKEQKEK